jgi:tRNA uridine 5-carboxymethylaminomethyl modification enzyme
MKNHNSNKARQACDVLVVGGGHAGCEAAASAARMGANTLLVTHSRATIGEMSCNPAIGGLGKGHLVREIDALDGLMGRVADAAGIQFRVLNKRKGPAVQGPRAQVDRKLYRQHMQQAIAETKNLAVFETAVENLLITDNTVMGIVTANGEEIHAGAIVLTTGTFLNGLIHLGETRTPAGRIGEKPAVGLAECLYSLGLRMGRLKTGTPARLDGTTINYEHLQPQPGDVPPQPFSFLSETMTTSQRPCHITHTNEATHEIIASNLARAPVYSGQIDSIGPRYCPSIEDKVVRFADKTSHQIFLEPEGFDDDTVYPNGISTSLPKDVQAAFIRSIAGLENVRIKQYGYAIEYDYVDPRELYPTLECKKLSRLFLAGQINGTTGYEEAAGQGLIAGINAARATGGCAADFVLSRTDAYIGVMIDDLITRGVSEPYRMFTSRAEYRLRLRSDNADQRLTGIGIEAGCIGKQRATEFTVKTDALARERKLLCELSITPNQAIQHNIKINLDGRRRSAFELLAYPDIGWEQLATIWPSELHGVPEKIAALLQADAHYHTYLQRQQEDVAALKKDEAISIPRNFIYKGIPGLSNEMVQKLQQHRPGSIGQASRIDGMTPAALMLLAANVSRETSR